MSDPKNTQSLILNHSTADLDHRYQNQFTFTKSLIK